MAFIFLSYSSADRPIARKVREALARHGYEGVFVDFNDIDPGAYWRDELARNLSSTDVLVFLGSPSSNESLWCAAEIGAARVLDKAIFPLLVSGGGPVEPGSLTEEGLPSPEVHEVLNDIEWIDADEDIEAAVAQLVKHLETLPSYEATKKSWDAKRAAWPGAHPYTLHDAGVFFGRDDLTRDLIKSQIDLPGGYDHDKIVCVVGAPGVGKSSLVRAGVLSSLPTTRWTMLPPVEPGTNVRDAIARAWHDEGFPDDSLHAFRNGDLALVDLLDSRFRSDLDWEGRALIVIDGLEALAAQPDHDAFFRELARVAGRRELYRVVTTSRPQTVVRLASAAEANARIATYPVLAMNRTELTSAITGPALRAGLKISTELVNEILDDVEDGSSLPLLCFCMSEMESLAREAGAGDLRRSDYLEAGGIQGVVTQRLESVAQRLPNGRPRVIELVLALVARADDEWTLPPLPIEALSDDQVEVLAALESVQLATRSESAVTTEVTPHLPLVQLTNSAILDWQPLAHHLDEIIEDRQLERTVLRDARAWRSQRESSDAHLSEAADEILPGEQRLAQIELMLRHRPVAAADPDVAEFMQAAQAARARRRRRHRMLLGAVAAALVVIAGLGAWALRSQGAAERERTIASARNLSLRALETPRIDQAMEAAFAASELEDSPEIALTTLSVLAREPFFRGYAEPTGDADGRVVLWSPSHQLIQATEIGTINIWNRDGSLEETERPTESFIRTGAMSPDGTWSAFGDLDGHVFIRSAAGNYTELTSSANRLHEGPVGWLTPIDSSRLLSAGADGRVVLSDTTTGTQVWELDLAVEVWSLAHLGQIVVAGTEDGTVHALDPASGQELWSIQLSPDTVRAMHGSASGLFAVTDDRRLWRVDIDEVGPANVAMVSRLPSAASSVAARSRTEAVVSLVNGEIRLISTLGSAPVVLRAHDQSLRSVALDPLTGWVAATGDDGLVSRWQPDGSPAIVQPIDHPFNAEVVADHSAAGLVVGGADGRVHLLEPGQTQPRLLADVSPAIINQVVATESVAIVASTGNLLVLVDLVSGDVTTAIEVGDDDLRAASVGDRVAVTLRPNAPDPDTPAEERGEVIILDEEGTVEFRADLDFRPAAVTGLADGRVVVGGSFAELALVEDGRITQLRAGRRLPNLVVTDLASDRDGNLLAITDNTGAVELWHADRLEPTGIVYSGHSGTAYDVELTSSGAIAVSVDSEGELRAWSTSTGVPTMPPLRTGLERVRSVAIDEASGVLYAAGLPGVVSVSLRDRDLAAIGAQLTWTDPPSFPADSARLLGGS